jgi:hypothetical protein
MEPRKQKAWRDSAPIDMFVSAVSVLVVVQLSSVPEGLMNNPVHHDAGIHEHQNEIGFVCDASLFRRVLITLHKRY